MFPVQYMPASYYPGAYFPPSGTSAPIVGFEPGNPRVFTARPDYSNAIENEDGGLGVEAGEDRLFDFDFARAVGQGETILSAPSISIQDVSADFGESAPSTPLSSADIKRVSFNGIRAQCLVDAQYGSEGVYYLECLAYTSTGEYIRCRGLLRVRLDV